MVSTSKTERRKTTGRNSNLIVFAEELKLPLPSKSLKNLNKCALDIAVWDKDSFGKETLIGEYISSYKNKKILLVYFSHAPSVTKKYHYNIFYI